MTILESILIYGGFSAFVISLILIQWFMATGRPSATRICIIVMLVSVIAYTIGATHYDDETLISENIDMAITIQDKEKTHAVSRYSTITSYYFIFDSNNKISVDNDTYNNYERGDIFIIHKVISYRLDRETGEKTVINVQYY